MIETKIDYAAKDREEAQQLTDLFIEKVNADHDDVISFNRGIGCQIRNHIELLRREEKRLRSDRDEWRRKYFEMERAQSRCIDDKGELLKRIMRLERDKDEIRSEITRCMPPKVSA